MNFTARCVSLVDEELHWVVVVVSYIYVCTNTYVYISIYVYPYIHKDICI
jgi:hypothetical protein